LFHLIFSTSLIFASCCACICDSPDLQSVTSIWTQSQHDQQPASVLVHSPPSDDQSLFAGPAAPSGMQRQPTEASSTDSRQMKRKRKSVRQLLSNRVAPLPVQSGTTDPEDASSSRQLRLDLPVYSQFVVDSGQMRTTDGSCCADTGCDSGDVACVESKNIAPCGGSERPKNEDEDSDSTVSVQSDHHSEVLSAADSSALEDVGSDDAGDIDNETNVHSDSNYSIASSDTAALSIKLDENYDPVVEPVSYATTDLKPPASFDKTSTAKAVVRPLESRRSHIPVLHASSSLPTSAATSKSNSATQTSVVNPPFSYYRQPYPYTMFGYGGYLPQMPPVCETPIWPPFVYPPPPLPWYYGSPLYDPLQYMPAAPPYCVVPPPATTVSNSNQSSFPQQGESVSRVANSQPPAVPEPSKPTVVPPGSFHEPAPAPLESEKLFRPIAARSGFRPTPESLFKPVSGPRRVGQSEAVVDEKTSRCLLEMVELITPQLDSATERTSENSEADVDDDAEDEAEREAWEAEERERQRMRRRHTRQWMRALRTDVEHAEYSDTSV